MRNDTCIVYHFIKKIAIIIYGLITNLNVFKDIIFILTTQRSLLY